MTIKKLLIFIFLFIIKITCIGQTHQLGVGWGNYGLGYFPARKSFPNYQANYIFSYSIFTAEVDYLYKPNSKEISFNALNIHIGIQTNPDKHFIARFSVGAQQLIPKDNSNNHYEFIEKQINPLLSANLFYKIKPKHSIALNFYQSIIQIKGKDMHGSPDNSKSPSLYFTISYFFTIFKPKQNP